MLKPLLSIGISLAFAIFLSGCSPQSTELPDMEKISDYLPITLNDEFRLVIIFHEALEKTDFSPSDLEIVYDALSSFMPHEPDTIYPWGDELIFGAPVFLYIKNESHAVRITFVSHSEGVFAGAWIDDEPEQWFTMDSASYINLTGLILQPS